MIVNILLIVSLAAVLAGLLAAAIFVRRRQRALFQQREALQKQRGAAHIRGIALAVQTHTGRADIAIVLLQLSCEMLEEAVKLAPAEASVNESLSALHGLMDSMQLDDRPPSPVPNGGSQADLSQASMQLTEAARLLVRLEARGELDSAELRSMQEEVRRVQRSLDFRTRIRRDLESPSTLIPDTESLLLETTLLDAPAAATPRAGPSH